MLLRPPSDALTLLGMLGKINEAVRFAAPPIKVVVSNVLLTVTGLALYVEDPVAYVWITVLGLLCRLTH